MKHTDSDAQGTTPTAKIKQQHATVRQKKNSDTKRRRNGKFCHQVPHQVPRIPTARQISRHVFTRSRGALQSDGEKEEKCRPTTKISERSQVLPSSAGDLKRENSGRSIGDHSNRNRRRFLVAAKNLIQWPREGESAALNQMDST